MSYRLGFFLLLLPKFESENVPCLKVIKKNLNRISKNNINNNKKNGGGGRKELLSVSVSLDSQVSKDFLTEKERNCYSRSGLTLLIEVPDR